MAEEVALVTAYNSKGELLLGTRNDNGRRTLPGGHVEPGEAPEAAARRELWEETGLHAQTLSFIRSYTNPQGLVLHCYSAFVTGEPHSHNDPDNECSRWDWIDITNGVPTKIWNNLHGPQDDQNLVRRIFESQGLEKAEEPLYKGSMQARLKFNPDQVDENDEAAIHQWQGPDRDFESRDMVPYMGGPERTRALSRLTAATTVRRGANGEPEYLLHRGMGPEERIATHQTPGFVNHEESLSSWTPRYSLARSFAMDYTKGTGGGLDSHVISAWIPQSAIHSIPKQYGATQQMRGDIDDSKVRGENRYSHEHEVILGPHTSQLATQQEVQNQQGKLKTSDEMVNRRSLGWTAQQQHHMGELKRAEQKAEHFGGADNKAPIPPKRDLGMACPHGQKVFLVDGEFVRDHHDSDFVEGGNSYRYRFVPRGEIWVDQDTPPHEIAYVIFHECQESEKMRAGESYDKAHDEAKRMEDAARHKDSVEMAKAEDEVSRLLDHPSIQERTLALKLNTVNSQHLQAASLDPHPDVHALAIAHPLFGHAEAAHLMGAAAGTDGKFPLTQQHAFLIQHERVRPYHLAAFVNNARAHATGDDLERSVAIAAGHPNLPPAVIRSLYLDARTSVPNRLTLLSHMKAPVDVLEHALHTGLIVPSAEASSLAQAAVEHPSMAPASVEHLVKLAGDKGEPHVVKIAEHALKTNATTPEMKEWLFTQALLKPRAPASRALLNAFLAGPSSKPEDTQRALGQMLNKSEALAKAVSPHHFSSIIKATDPEAHKLVDHKPDLTAHPPSMGPEVEAYHQNVVNSSHKVGGHSAGSAGLGTGITRKKIFRYQVPGQAEPGRAMVKPYNERVIQRCKSWMKYPIQGWAEMTTQALFHAGGIGHLHQKVHVAEHDMGPGHEHEPALVVHISPNHLPASDGGLTHYKPDHDLDSRKIAIMDWLSNNNDRHGGNILFNTQTGAPLAIDHSRNFQYIRSMPGGPGAGNTPEGEDQFVGYTKGGLDSIAGPVTESIRNAYDYDKPSDRQRAFYDAQLDGLRKYAPAFDWWGEKGGAIRKAFNDRLDQIKDPEVRDHLRRNFNARADWLDERAHFGLENFGTSWYHDTVPLYKPDQLSEAEKEDPEAVARFEERVRAKQEAKRKASAEKRGAKKAYKDWLNEKPQYPHNLFRMNLPKEQLDQHPDWKKYVEAYNPWLARRPAEAP